MFDPHGALDGLAERAVRLWGHASQWRMVQEEAGELIAAINRADRGRDGAAANLVEEVADFLIMLHQARLMLGQDLVDDAIGRKLARLEDRLAKGEEAKRG